MNAAGLYTVIPCAIRWPIPACDYRQFSVAEEAPPWDTSPRGQRHERLAWDEEPEGKSGAEPPGGQKVTKRDTSQVALRAVQRVVPRAGLTLAPGQRGTKKLTVEYGDRLLCVRYRYDEEGERRIKTAEIVIEEVPYVSKRKGNSEVGVRILWRERDMAATVKGAGGRWDKVQGAWLLPYRTALALGLRHRLVPLTSPGQSR